MFKKIFVLMLAAMLTSINVTAADVMKIAMNGEVKVAKEIGTGKGISFSLPELEDSEYYINSIELAVFEKQYGESDWKMYLNDEQEESKKILLNEPDSLNILADFGEFNDYRDKAKYKLAYRYYAQSVSDESIIMIAGEGEKDGWRLVGENDGITATSDGFSFYKNATPVLTVESLVYKIHTGEGLKDKICTLNDLKSVLLPEDAFINGVKVNLIASDFDMEDILTAQYTLRDKATGDDIAYGVLPADNRIISQTTAENIQLKITVSDNFGASVSSNWIDITIDKVMPIVTEEFDDGGYYLRGKNLFSDFTVIDNGSLMTDGRVYADIYIGSTFIKRTELENKDNGIYRLDESSMDDGEYTVKLQIYDRAGNEENHTFYQKLDNTTPEAVFLTPENDSEATLYSTWMNMSKKLVISVEDNGAKLEKYSLNGNERKIHGTPSEHVVKESVTTSKTGKIKYSGYIYDNARAIDKSNNKYKADSDGNALSFSKEVWLDKTKPILTNNIKSEEWESVPKMVMATFKDLPSASDVDDASGIKERFYSITDSEGVMGEWINYTMPFNVNEGGVYYIHFKAIDYAGNEAVYTHKVKLNTISEIRSGVVPTDSSMHTIYYSNGTMHVARNTAYSTKYHFTVSDEDINDIIVANIKLVNRDNSAVFANAKVEKAPTGEVVRDIEFNMQYLDGERNKLPDGVYDLYVNITEKKADGEMIDTHSGVLGCSVVIKRTAPPVPVISVSGDNVDIEYPDEPLADSLNIPEIRALYKKQYKAVKTGESDSIYIDYTGSFQADNMTVTAIYTDVAGNISVTEKRIYGNEEEAGSSVDITTEGNTVTVEESRVADTYFIGIRREKQSGILADIFEFME